mmetsp:Transcript_16996/g.40041  ORF Transcript_16996/g.40041 Transcript_16996/m.40041 type:complete len:294 (-) Transcript_16996:19-900(-)
MRAAAAIRASRREDRARRVDRSAPHRCGSTFQAFPRRSCRCSRSLDLPACPRHGGCGPKLPPPSLCPSPCLPWHCSHSRSHTRISPFLYRLCLFLHCLPLHPCASRHAPSNMGKPMSKFHPCLCPNSSLCRRSRPWVWTFPSFCHSSCQGPNLHRNCCNCSCLNSHPYVRSSPRYSSSPWGPCPCSCRRSFRRPPARPSSCPAFGRKSCGNLHLCLCCLWPFPSLSPRNHSPCLCPFCLCPFGAPKWSRSSPRASGPDRPAWRQRRRGPAAPNCTAVGSWLWPLWPWLCHCGS